MITMVLSMERISVLARQLGLTSTTCTAFKTPGKIQEKLEMYGPVWCSGFRADGHKHIVVLRGVRETWHSAPEVYINDPFRGLTGAKARPSWWSFSRFAYKLNPVPYACQHWF